jgi:hypothetical protein
MKERRFCCDRLPAVLLAIGGGAMSLESGAASSDGVDTARGGSAATSSGW